MTNKSFWPVVCISVLIAGMLGCGTGSFSAATQQSSKPEFLYVTAATGPVTSPTFQLSTFKIDSSSGALSATSTMPLTQIVTGIAADSSSKFLYLSSPSPLASFVGIYSIDATSGAPTSDGSLLLTSVCAFCPPPSEPGALALNPTGNLLYYGSSSLGIGVAQGVGALTLDSSTGGLTPVPGSPFPAEQAPFLVAVHPSGQFVYTEDASGIGLVGLALENISAFSVGSGTGALSPVQGSPFTPPTTGDVAGFAMHPSGKFLYVTTGRAANGILAWSIDAITGELTNLPGSPFQPGVASFGGTFDPAGKFFYVSAGGDGGIDGFSVDSNSGALTPLASSPFASGSVMSDPVVDPSGNFLFTVDALNSAITGFSVDATTGALTELGNPAMLNGQTGLMTIVKAP
jgi:6-phosphogluconolactonase